MSWGPAAKITPSNITQVLNFFMSCLRRIIMQSSKIFCNLIFVVFAAQFKLNAANGRLPWIVNPQDLKPGSDIIVYHTYLPPFFIYFDSFNVELVSVML